MKRIFLFVLFLSTFGCTHYIVRENNEFELSEREIIFLKGKKIGLIGFHPFVSRTRIVTLEEALNTKLDIPSPNHLRIIEFVNENPKGKIFENNFQDNLISFQQYSSRYSRGILQTDLSFDNNVRQNQFLEYGKGFHQLNSNEVNSNISQEKLKEFLIIYLRDTKRLGLSEVENLLSIPKEKEDTDTIRMKNFNVDYWVIGIYRPNYDIVRGNVKGVKAALSAFAFILSLGIFPFWDEEGVTAKFYIFDKDLNQIGEIENKSIHDSITAWWLFGGARRGYPVSPEANFYKPNLQQFSKELVSVLKK
ncbi:MAG: hypothetical protein KA146_11425 [Leptospiraceae bacterium]|nr:hypothetical protein [Leptospiraceae bacterium]